MTVLRRSMNLGRSIERRIRQFRHHGRRIRLRQEHVSCACCSVRNSRPAARSWSTASRLPSEPSPERGIVFPALFGVSASERAGQCRCSASSSKPRLPGPAASSAPERRQAEEEAERLDRSCRGSTMSGMRAPRRSRAVCSSVSRSRRRLILKPKILLLDEPFGALDPGIRDDMHELLMTELWRETGMTVFMVTHDLKRSVQAWHARPDLR